MNWLEIVAVLLIQIYTIVGALWGTAMTVIALEDTPADGWKLVRIFSLGVLCWPLLAFTYVVAKEPRDWISRFYYGKREAQGE